MINSWNRFASFKKFSGISIAFGALTADCTSSPLGFMFIGTPLYTYLLFLLYRKPAVPTTKETLIFSKDFGMRACLKILSKKPLLRLYKPWKQCYD